MDIATAMDEVAERDWEERSVPPVRLALVGVGGFVRRRALPALDDSDYCTAAALVTGDLDDARHVAGEHGVETILTYEEFHGGAATDAYDAVYVATPNAHHLRVVETAAEQGKPVLCEKPLEATVERAERLVSACQSGDVPLMTAYRLQADPVVRRARELVAGGAIGDPVKVHGEFSVDLLAADPDPDQWRLDADLAGGGALVDLGVYPLNTTRFVLDADPAAVHGTTATTGPPFDDVEEHVAFEARFPGVATGVFTASYRAHVEDRLQVLGTGGQVELENAFYAEAHRTLRVERDGKRWTVEGEGTNEVREEFDYFAHALRNGAPLEPDGEDGLTDMRTIEAVYEADRTGERVTL
ncbi:MAG: D-xylose 1-dehydrogenase Gfo6 [Halobacteriaceae archaeon]